jgi:hypothetical protein
MPFTPVHQTLLPIVAFFDPQSVGQLSSSSILPCCLSFFLRFTAGNEQCVAREAS